MPSTITHAYFARDVYDKLSNKCQDRIKNKQNYYFLFAQGSDTFMFYHLFVGKRAKEGDNIQKTMHTTKTQEFFTKLIKYIYDNQLNDDEEVMAYLYGYITHYWLDCYTHPYIFYKTGVFNKLNKDSYKYNGLHQRLEYLIDIYFLNKRESRRPKDLKIYKIFREVKGFSPTLMNTIDECIGDVYGFKNVTSTYLKSIRDMRRFMWLANYDPYGIKLRIYSLIDKITPDSVIKLSELSYYNTCDNMDKWLNWDKKTWYHPCTKIKHKESFLELYDFALKEAIKTIDMVTELLNKKDLDIKKLHSVFQDLSFTTGEPVKDNLEIKYFEF